AALYALAALRGRPPGQVPPGAIRCSRVPRLADTLPVGDATALLARRPDIRQAERLLAAETARIGVATAALYPQINVMGSVSLSAANADDLFTDDAFGFSIGPFLSWSFPNLGAARARVRQAEARTEAALATFDGAVLTALRETESALARYVATERQRVLLVDAEEAATEASRLTEIRFDAGRDSLFELIEEQRTRADVRAQRAAAETALGEAGVALFRALGGGWDVTSEATSSEQTDGDTASRD
ncbi:MAG: TolC family protein, partial [Pacificimonas sp.]